MPQFISIKTFDTSKRTSGFAQEEFKQPIKQLQHQFRSPN